MKAARHSVRLLDVVLTSDCNLRCRYCYQNAKRPGLMDWRTLRAALDFLLRTTRDEVQVYFVGGEPLLAFDLMKRGVEYIEARKPRRLAIRFALATNGLLLDERRARFLEAHRFQLKLSFDGVPALQEIRGHATFARLDRLVERLRRRHPRLFHEQLSVTTVLTPRSIQWFAAAVRYLLSKGVPEFAVSPAMGTAAWNPRLRRQLGKEFAAVYEACRDHHRRTGLVPLTWLRRGATPTRAERYDWFCGIGTGESLTVDVDGTLHGCVTLARSYQRFPSTRLGRALGRLDLGRLTDPGLASRLESYRRSVAATRVFNDRDRKRSAYGRCRTCAFRSRCLVCPMAIVLHGSDNPHRVPDFACAFNRLSAFYQRRFPSVPSPEPWLDEYRAARDAARDFLARRAAGGTRSTSGQA